MTFWTLYFLALVPIIVVGILFVLDKEINWIEWLAGSAIAFMVAGLFHVISVHGLTADTETWSGRIEQARYFTAWEEYYEYAVYRTEVYTVTHTDSKGNSYTTLETRQVFDHWEPTSRWHGEHFESYSNINTSYATTKEKYFYYIKKFNDNHTVAGKRYTGEHNSRMIGGNPNDYVSDNKTNWTEPVTKLVSFENRVKAAPSVFTFAKASEDIKIFDYPKNDNPFISDRLLGSAAVLDIFKFDQMNARLGPTKKVNVIMVGCGDKSSIYSNWQEAAWFGGKKNDIIICWGGSNKSPAWVRVFSWGEGLAKRNIETMLLTRGVSNEILPDIEREIVNHFTRADWSKFDYLRVEIPSKYLWWYLSILILIEVGFFTWCHLNSWDKQGDKNGRTNKYGYYPRNFRRFY